MSRLFPPAAAGALLLSAASLPAFGADVSGEWSIDGRLNGNPISFDCTFQQTERNVRGHCKASDLASEAKGTVTDDAVQFSIVYNFAGVAYTCIYSGKLTGNAEFRGTVVVLGIDGTTGEFVAKKT